MAKSSLLFADAVSQARNHTAMELIAKLDSRLNLKTSKFSDASDGELILAGYGFQE
jgi:hypothetical protein